MILERLKGLQEILSKNKIPATTSITRNGEVVEKAEVIVNLEKPIKELEELVGCELKGNVKFIFNKNAIIVAKL